MTATWRPSRLHPDRLHLPAADGRARCGATVTEPVRCALCVLLAEDDAADTPPADHG